MITPLIADQVLITEEPRSIDDLEERKNEWRGEYVGKLCMHSIPKLLARVRLIATVKV